MGTFDQLPATIARILTGSSTGSPLDETFFGARFDRVALVYLDAFGWSIVERLRSHRVIRRAETDGILRQLRSQFPSTTAAHVTTIHSGLPVGEHGVYEWFILEPSLNRLIMPLPFSYAGDGERERLAGVLDPRTVFPEGVFYPLLAAEGVSVTVVQPASFANGSPNSVLLAASRVLPSRSAEHAVRRCAEALAAHERVYAHLYLPEVDSLMHQLGPDDPAVLRAFDRMLTLVARAALPAGTLVLLTSDHGMAPVSPERTVYVNELWPELVELLEVGADGKPLAPAGSCRDLFLHVKENELSRAQVELASRLDRVAEVHTAAELIERGVIVGPSPALRARLGNLVVLPALGEAVFWHEPGRFEQRLHGQHGGLSDREVEIPLLAWVA